MDKIIDRRLILTKQGTLAAEIQFWAECEAELCKLLDSKNIRRNSTRRDNPHYYTVEVHNLTHEALMDALKEWKGSVGWGRAFRMNYGSEITSTYGTIKRDKAGMPLIVYQSFNNGRGAKHALVLPIKPGEEDSPDLILNYADLQLRIGPDAEFTD